MIINLIFYILFIFFHKFCENINITTNNLIEVNYIDNLNKIMTKILFVQKIYFIFYNITLYMIMYFNFIFIVFVIY